MTLVHHYAPLIRSALAAAIDTRALAEAWSALHPGALKAKRQPDPAAVAFADRAHAAISNALRGVLVHLWPEGWALGQQSAEAAVARARTATKTAEPADAIAWGWTPGDWAAAERIAGPGLARLLDEADVTIGSIAATRINDLADILAEALADGDSVDQLAADLADLLDDPAMAELVAQTELARANSMAAIESYLSAQVGMVDIATANDNRVCGPCEDAAGAGPYNIADAPGVPLHPRCRCMPVPVAESIPMSIGDLVGAM